jgi:hypothetical protein
VGEVDPNICIVPFSEATLKQMVLVVVGSDGWLKK